MAPATGSFLPDLHGVFGFGVAGNFAGHLEQAGEAADFAQVTTEGGAAGVAEPPKGIFPWYVPGGGDEVPGFLHTFPLSSHEVALPPGEAVNLQIEPEVGLLARVTYGDGDEGDEGGGVVALTPVAIAAFNDCSIRRPGAKKISHKKNWGPSSKGLAERLIPTTSLEPDGPTAGYRLASFLRRGGETHAYGLDSALEEYSYYGATLLDWIADRLTHQHGSDDTPLEPVGRYLQAAGRPEHVLVGIGATRYTPLGASTFLELGDESVVVVYDGARTSPQAVAEAVAAGLEDGLEAASVLVQRVVPGEATPIT